MEIRAIKGGEGVPTPNGKCHFKFPFWLIEPFLNYLTLTAIPPPFPKKAIYFIFGRQAPPG